MLVIINWMVFLFFVLKLLSSKNKIYLSALAAAASSRARRAALLLGPTRRPVVF